MDGEAVSYFKPKAFLERDSSSSANRRCSLDAVLVVGDPDRIRTCDPQIRNRTLITLGSPSDPFK